MIQLQDTHPLLFDFFAGYFPDADLDGLSDIEVVQQYISDNSEEINTLTLEKLNTIDDDEYILQAIAKEANRYFENTHEIKDWLQMIKNTFK
ncbi:hypothetical protein [Tenacibaculum agarivorans]|uniref:hypothetical protein n=1 Tax=Tenacibaculum agarivorans TaxID=1908389 RepID=UPI00094BC557|nr:hypothetical protein [Tenacibaculum agarivorans]